MTNAKFVYSVGVAVFVRKDRHLLVGARGKACSRGAGCLALPGGMVESGETVAAAVQREVLQETGLCVELVGGYPMKPGVEPNSYGMPFAVPGLLAVTDHNDISQQMDGQLLPHLTLWVMTVWNGGEPERREPNKCDGWTWTEPAAIAKLPGVNNPTHPQYYWTPIPLWRKILRPYWTF